METKRDYRIIDYVQRHHEETVSLLKELAAIGAPTYHEVRRAQFCLEWLKKQGAEGVYIDECGNVVFPYQCNRDSKCIAFMAHMDVVFPEEGEIPVHEDEETLRAPGVGDDTANLVNLLLTVKYILENPPGQLERGLLFVANTCEEGLGNSNGAKWIFNQYSGIEEMISFDIFTGRLICSAVGSHRYKIQVKTEGGHSHEDFGKPNAILIMAEIIRSLYAIPVPGCGKTTYNVGVIRGGTSVNAIAGDVMIYYEFRSQSEEALKYMEQKFYEVLKLHMAEDVRISWEVLGIRPCDSSELPKEMQQDLVERQRRLIELYTDEEVQICAGPTDANIPLSLGIPAVTLGTVKGGGGHTYEEWIEKGSLIEGQQLALATILQYTMAV